MALLVGTTDALYRITDRGVDDPAPVLEPGHVRGLARRTDGVVAAADDGLYRTTDAREWDRLSAPFDAPTAITATRRGLQVGTRPAKLFESIDGADWQQHHSFGRFPGSDDWVHGGGGPAQVRTIAWHPEAPSRLVVGIESAGVLLTDDAGRTWVRRSEGLNQDVHHLQALGPRRYISATGGGLYRTEDAGRTWLRCDTHVDHFQQRYCRETLVHEGVLYAGLAGSGPFWDGPAGADAVLLRSTDDGRTLSSESYPGCPESFVVSFGGWQGRPVAGTNEGTVLERTDQGWQHLGSVPVTDRARGAYGITAMLEL